VNYRRIREEAYAANMRILDAGLVVLTWGNASAADRNDGVFAIKPSGVDYAELSPAAIVIVDVTTGHVVEGDFRPSSDTATHRVLYREFPEVGGVVHTHSKFATSWAQGRRPIPAYGTTHADHWNGHVPLVRELTADEVGRDYEGSTGQAIVDSFRAEGLAALECPGALLPHHGPFTWGKTAAEAASNAIALEAIAEMATYSERINPELPTIPDFMLEKHHSRKHGPGAYYGQRET
jgi:L-ribulose-5-phosphate 4-epimerase